MSRARGASRVPVLLLATAAAIALAAAAIVWLRVGRRPPSLVVLVTVDTLRRDATGVYGSATATPRIDALAARGTRFLDARTPVPLTLPAHVTMMTGLPPARHGVRSNSASRVPPRERRPFPLLAERMAAAGRRCGAFVSAGPLVKRYGLSQGFEAYDDEGLAARTGSAYRERAGTRTVERALAWVRALPEGAPAFLWVHLFEPHEPHPAGLSPAAGYAADVQAADAAVGLLLDGLAAAGRGDAVVALASDHGEALGDEGEPTHGYLLVEAVMRVPLVLAGPGVPAGAVRSDPADLADVAPTLAALAGLDPAAPGGIGGGLDLLAGAAPADRARVAEGLHAHHQFRWAQLSSALVGPWCLEDRGLGRERLFRLDLTGPAAPRGDGVPAAGRPEATAPADALREYRRLERRAPAEPGRAPGGYGAGGTVGPFLDPAENARLPDPYAAIADAERIALVTAHLEMHLRPESLLDEIAPLLARDPGNPAIHFVRGRVLHAARRLPEAASEFAKAYERGRDDPETVGLWAGSIADQGGEENRRAAALVLEAGLQKTGDEVRLLCLLHRLRRDLGEAAKAEEAKTRAKAAVVDPEDEARFQSGCK